MDQPANIIAASTPNPALPYEEASVSPGREALSQLQRDFAVHFVLCGGKPRRAALLAGYSTKSASISAHRNLVNPRVLAEIKRLSMCNAEAALPLAIRTWINICISGKDERARVQAAEKIALLAGAMPKGQAPNVAVQINVNGQQAQALIREVWTAKERRESDIGGGMSDIPDAPMIDATPVEATAIAPPAGDGGGGELGQGPPRVPVPIPPPATEQLLETTGGEDAERELPAARPGNEAAADAGPSAGADPGGGADDPGGLLAAWRDATARGAGVEHGRE